MLTQYLATLDRYMIVHELVEKFTSSFWFERSWTHWKLILLINLTSRFDRGSWLFHQCSVCSRFVYSWVEADWVRRGRGWELKNGFTTAYSHNELLILEEKKSVSVYLTLSLSTFCLRALRVSFEPEHKILKYDLFNQISGFSISIDALCTLILHLENIFLSFTLATLEVSSSYQLQH